MNVGVTINFVS